MATTTKRRATERLQVGFGLISFSAVIVVIGLFVAVFATRIVPVRLLILALFVAAIAALWGTAINNGRHERAARLRLKEENPGALVERVRVWALPKGRLERDTPMQFLIADAETVSFQTIDEVVLLTIPVEEIGFVGLVTAQGDGARDKALTLIYGDDQLTVQFFTLTYSAMDRLLTRVTTAIDWPADGTPRQSA